MKCGGCLRRLEVGDRYIEGTASEYMGDTDQGLDGLLAELMGSGHGDKIVFCEDEPEEG